MGQPLRIYSGAGAQISLYDATNGPLWLGYVADEINVIGTPSDVGLSDGNRVQFNHIHSVTIPIVQTDSTLLASLIARKGILQELYLVSIDSAYKFTDVLIQVAMNRNFKPGSDTGSHRFILTAKRVQQDKAAAASLPETHYCQFIQNLLGSFGNMNTDAGGGVPTGWTNSGASSPSVTTSHLGGGYGNEWRFTLSDSGDYVYCRVRLPLDQTPIKITLSAYIDNRKSGTSYFKFAYILRDSSLSSVASALSDEKTQANGANARETEEWTITPAADACYIDFAIYGTDTGTAELGVDNVQAEIGELTDYVENDF
jgi:hypothetical protein